MENGINELRSRMHPSQRPFSFRVYKMFFFFFWNSSFDCPSPHPPPPHSNAQNHNSYADTYKILPFLFHHLTTFSFLLRVEMRLKTRKIISEVNVVYYTRLPSLQRATQNVGNVECQRRETHFSRRDYKTLHARNTSKNVLTMSRGNGRQSSR